MAIQETSCDRVRVQALDGSAYGAIISPVDVSSPTYASTTQWLVLGGVHAGEILTTLEVETVYVDYSDACTDPPEPGIYESPYVNAYA